MNRRPYTIGFLTVLLLVALRVVIGWHFFQEGLAHKNDPHWSSESFLRGAKGPLAEQFQRWAPGFHRWDRLLAAPLAPEPAALPNEGNSGDAPKEAAAKPSAGESPVYGEWYQQAVRDWSDRQAEIANFYRFTDEQKQSAAKTVSHYADELAALLANDEADIAAYRHELYRNVQMAAQPGADEIPNKKARLARRQQNPLGEPGLSGGTSPVEWQSDAEALERAWQREVLVLRSDEQMKLGPMAETKTDLKKIDTAITWLLLVGGGLLMIGLFTRLSALALALFLIAVIASQPPWIAGAAETYYQGVECVALLALATSPAGRWAGLDFFIHYVFLRPFRAR